MKRVMRTVFSVFLLAVMFAVTGIQAEAASKAEIESTGTQMTLNKESKGCLEGRLDEEWFIFKVTQPGCFSLTFNTVYADADEIHNGWNMEIYDANDLTKCIRSYSKMLNTWTTPNFAMHTGTYYVKVYSNQTWGDEAAPVDCEYGLCPNYTVDSAWESEYNDGSSTANKKQVNSVIKGNLYHCQDVDWYSFTVDKAGLFQIHMNYPDTVDIDDVHNGWKISFMDSNYNEIRSFETKSEYTSPYYAFEAGTYYVKVYAVSTWGDEGAPTACDYLLTLKHTVASNWESEYNDGSASADVITCGNVYHGTLFQRIDVDWYRFNLSKKGKVQIKLTKEQNVSIEDAQHGWNVAVISAKTNEVTEVLSGVTTEGTYELTLDKGTYYVKVYAKSSWSDKYSPLGCQYDLKVSTCPSPNKTKITSIKSAKKKVTLKWKKVSGANGYYIYRATSKTGAYKKIATIKKGSVVKYTDKKSLKKKKTYYYKVVAYKKSQGLTATSTASAVKKIKVK